MPKTMMYIGSPALIGHGMDEIKVRAGDRAEVEPVGDQYNSMWYEDMWAATFILPDGSRHGPVYMNRSKFAPDMDEINAVQALTTPNFPAFIIFVAAFLGLIAAAVLLYNLLT